eukprot:3940594-Rhodomonas_salina.1
MHVHRRVRSLQVRSKVDALRLALAREVHAHPQRQVGRASLASALGTWSADECSEYKQHPEICPQGAVIEPCFPLPSPIPGGEARTANSKAKQPRAPFSGTKATGTKCTSRLCLRVFCGTVLRCTVRVLLRSCYVVSGTGVVYAATPSSYEFATPGLVAPTRFPVLTSAMLPRGFQY